jgi:MFS family permease
MAGSGTSAAAQLITDVHGRRYLVGESAAELTGLQRKWMLRLPWLAMAAFSVLQYGVAAMLPKLAAANGWSTSDALTVLGLWVVCQAGIAAPAVWLYQRTQRGLLIVAALLGAIALVTLAHTTSLTAALLGYSVLGGLGAGLAYASCVGAVTEWFPERIAGATGAVSGAFGYGALPFILLSPWAPSERLFDVTALILLAAAATAGLLLRRPPACWWPAEIDPRLWAVDRRLNRSIPNNIPAVRAFTPSAALRSGMLPLMVAVVVLVSAMALFDVGYLATSSGPALTLGALALATGLGRVATGRLSDQIGRRRMLIFALLVGAFAQFGLLVTAGHPAAVVIAAGIAGVGTGAGYSLLVSLVRDWFGDEATLPNYALVYTGKAVGGVAGLALAAAPGRLPAFAVAGCLGLAGSLLATRLRQPGRPALLLHR